MASSALPSHSAAIAQALATCDPINKIKATRAVARNWRLGRLAHRFDTPMPDRPGRPHHPILLAPGKMPRRGGSGTKQIALLHALAHIECVAIDLALDLAGRFGEGQPAAFIDDWLSVSADEAMHFALLDRRLKSLGSHYGALPAHDGLWEAAAETRHDILARLAIVPLVLEARGLDVTPATISRFEAANDPASARILRRIYADEINHVRTGFHWFSTLCAKSGFDSESHWQGLVRLHFKGSLKPPFNDSARESAGLPRNYYAALAKAGDATQTTISKSEGRTCC
jgi:uncharacterized ferritin-like protein (DUF455 family)